MYLSNEIKLRHIGYARKFATTAAVDRHTSDERSPSMGELASTHTQKYCHERDMAVKRLYSKTLMTSLISVG